MAWVRKIVIVVQIKLHCTPRCMILSSFRMSVLGFSLWFNWSRFTTRLGVTVAHLEKF